MQQSTLHGVCLVQSVLWTHRHCSRLQWQRASADLIWSSGSLQTSHLCLPSFIYTEAKWTIFHFEIFTFEKLHDMFLTISRFLFKYSWNSSSNILGQKITKIYNSSRHYNHYNYDCTYRKRNKLSKNCNVLNVGLREEIWKRNVGNWQLLMKVRPKQQ